MNKSIPTIIFLITIFFISCSKSTSSTSTSTSSNYFKATVGGVSFSGTGGNAGATFIKPTLTIQGINDGVVNSILQLRIINTTIVIGKVNIDGLNCVAAYVGSSTHHDADSGYVDITAVTPNIVGTFYFHCSDGTEVTNGSFSLTHP